MSKPIAVAISDIHFNISTLPIATVALQAALTKAEDLNVSLIIAGDLNDTKAIIRAEVANSLIDILKHARVKVYILEGNHDKVNEKGAEHGLNYLRPYADIIDFPTYKYFEKTLVGLIPYQTDPKIALKDFRQVPNQMLIMHQGFLGAHMGDYIQDKTSMDISLVKDFRVFSGHYHRHQTLGTVTYIGSPYTITFGEANDGPKGFIIINNDGTFTREILYLRKHVKLELDSANLPDHKYAHIRKDDLIWLKLTGTRSELSTIDKNEIGNRLFGHSNFKLDLTPVEQETTLEHMDEMTDKELFDELIRVYSESDSEIEYLKALWRDLI